MILFYKILNSNYNVEILNHVIWLLSHLVTESTEVKNIILASPLYNKILNSLKQQSLNTETLRLGSWFFGLLSKGSPAPSLLQVNFLIFFNIF